MSIFVVVARRWGKSESHHYIVNNEAFTDTGVANVLAREEEQYRGGKYVCTVEKLAVNSKSINVKTSA